MLSGAAAGTPSSGLPGSPWAAGRAPTAADQLPTTRRLSRPLGGAAATAAAQTVVAGPSSTQFSSGRRAISAQTVLRDEAVGGSRPSQIQSRSSSNATDSATTSVRAGGTPSVPIGSGGRRAVMSGPTLPVGPPAVGSGPMLAASPPYPKAVYSQRTQSGPARMCEEDTVLSGAIDQQQPGTPTSAKHGRRQGFHHRTVSSLNYPPICMLLYPSSFKLAYGPCAFFLCDTAQVRDGHGDGRS